VRSILPAWQMLGIEAVAWSADWTTQLHSQLHARPREQQRWQEFRSGDQECLAAEARKAESASTEALRIPSPPSVTDRRA